MRIGEEIILNTRILNGMLNEDAVFSDETENYISPFEPDETDKVKIRIRIGVGDADAVFFVCNEECLPMEHEKTKELFDFYYIILPPEKDDRSYAFKIVCGNDEYYFNKYGVSRRLEKNGNFYLNRHFKTPKWARGAVGYQIFTDRFCNGDTSNDVVDDEYTYLGRQAKAVKDWSEYPQASDVSNFYGGDIQGIIDKLDYLEDLGIEMIYVNPLFVSPSNHKYDTQDYEHIDPHYGKIVKDTDDFEKKYAVRTASKENLEASDALFAELVKKAHEKGIKIIIDGVFNHCGSFNKWMDKEKIYESIGGYEKGAFIAEDSPYHDFFKWLGGQWPDNNEYDSWWGHKNHPKLNYEQSDKLVEYIMQVGEKWLKPPYNADGWRIDVAADLGFSTEYNHKFWQMFRKRVKAVNPDAVIIAEHYGDAFDWLEGNEWDTVMNYDAFMEPVSWFFTGMEKHSDGFDGGKYRNGKEFEYSMIANTVRLGGHALELSMNELSNHDHSRFLTRTNHRVGRLSALGSEAAGENVNIGVMKDAVLFQFMWPGLPTVYYGDEAGVAGWTDPDNRRTYPWGSENMELLNFHKAVIAMRKKYNVLRMGSFRFVYSDYGVVALSRFDDNMQITAVFNNCDEDKTISVPLWLAGAKTQGEAEKIFESDYNGFNENVEKYSIKDGFVEVTVKSSGCLVLKSE